MLPVCSPSHRYAHPGRAIPPPTPPLYPLYSPSKPLVSPFYDNTGGLQGAYRGFTRGIEGDYWGLSWGYAEGLGLNAGSSAMTKARLADKTAWQAHNS